MTSKSKRIINIVRRPNDFYIAINTVGQSHNEIDAPANFNINNSSYPLTPFIVFLLRISLGVHSRFTP